MSQLYEEEGSGTCSSFYETRLKRSITPASRSTADVPTDTAAPVSAAVFAVTAATSSKHSKRTVWRGDIDQEKEVFL